MKHEYQLWSEDAEMSFLGSLFLLRDDEAIQASESAVPDDFWKPCHRILFTTMRLLAMRGIPLDLVTVKNELQDDGTLETAGGTEYLIQIAETVPSAGNWEAYLDILKGYTYKRMCEAFCRELMAKVHDQCETKEIESYVEAGIPKSMKSIEPILLKNVHLSGKAHAIPSHSKFLNAASGGGGYVIGQASVISAGTKGGKTAWMTNSALFAARKGFRVLYALFADLDPEQFKNRLFKHLTGKDEANLIDADDVKVIRDIEALPIEVFHHVQHGSTLRDLETFINSRKRRGVEVQILFADYIQMIDGDSSSGRTDETEKISKRFNQMAARHGYAAVIGSQVTVNPDGTLSAKYAKEIEENAALTLQLAPDKDEPMTRRKVFIKWNRFGPSNVFVGARWDDQRLVFVEDAR